MDEAVHGSSAPAAGEAQTVATPGSPLGNCSRRGDCACASAGLLPLPPLLPPLLPPPPAGNMTTLRSEPPPPTHPPVRASCHQGRGRLSPSGQLVAAFWLRSRAQRAGRPGEERCGAAVSRGEPRPTLLGCCFKKCPRGAIPASPRKRRGRSGRWEAPKPKRKARKDPEEPAGCAFSTLDSEARRRRFQDSGQQSWAAAFSAPWRALHAAPGCRREAGRPGGLCLRHRSAGCPSKMDPAGDHRPPHPPRNPGKGDGWDRAAKGGSPLLLEENLGRDPPRAPSPGWIPPSRKEEGRSKDPILRRSKRTGRFPRIGRSGAAALRGGMPAAPLASKVLRRGGSSWTGEGAPGLPSAGRRGCWIIHKTEAFVSGRGGGERSERRREVGGGGGGERGWQLVWHGG